VDSLRSTQSAQRESQGWLQKVQKHKRESQPPGASGGAGVFNFPGSTSGGGDSGGVHGGHRAGGKGLRYAWQGFLT